MAMAFAFLLAGRHANRSGFVFQRHHRFAKYLAFWEGRWRRPLVMSTIDPLRPGYSRNSIHREKAGSGKNGSVPSKAPPLFARDALGFASLGYQGSRGLVADNTKAELENERDGQADRYNNETGSTND